jgi:hypothetical protein
LDEHNAETILAFLNRDKSNSKKFNYVVELLLEHVHVPRDLYDKENFEPGCEHVTAIKLFKGKMNPRIYCQQYAYKQKEIFVIIVSELLVKKKTRKLTHVEKGIIRRVASFNYTIKEDE